MYLREKKILLGISGGIAAYKMCQFIRILQEEGADVRVMATPSALQFVTPLTLSTLSRHDVATTLFPDNADTQLVHLDLHRWADCILVAPATANVLAQAAHGLADGLFSTTLLSHDKPILFAPAMHDTMYLNQAMQNNIKTLKSFGHILIGPEHGKLADDTVGAGRLVDERVLLQALEIHFAPKDLTGRRVLVTAGRTEEPLDPVRYITNASSGRMGTALAGEAALRGGTVTLIHGTMDVMPPLGVTTIAVRTAAEMYTAVQKQLRGTHLIMMAAAVSDYRPKRQAKDKLKKDRKGLTLHLTENDDILAMAGKRKGCFVVGFSVETENEIANSRKKLRAKNCNLMVVNNPTEPGAGFGAPTNKVTILSADGTHEALPVMPKKEVARELIDRVVPLLPARQAHGKKRTR